MAKGVKYQYNNMEDWIRGKMINNIKAFTLHLVMILLSFIIMISVDWWKSVGSIRGVK